MKPPKIDLIDEPVKSPPLPKDKQELINKLAAYHHDILSPKGVLEFCDAFGVPTPRMISYKDSRSEFKGVTLAGPNTEEGDEAVGYGGTELAEHICGCFNLVYRSCMGRGFQMQACCDSLSKFFKKNPDAKYVPPKPVKKGKKK